MQVQWGKKLTTVLLGIGFPLLSWAGSGPWVAGNNNASVYELNCFVSMLPIIILFISGQRYSEHVFSEASHIISEPHTVLDFSYSLASL